MSINHVNMIKNKPRNLDPSFVYIVFKHTRMGCCYEKPAIGFHTLNVIRQMIYLKIIYVVGVL